MFAILINFAILAIGTVAYLLGKAVGEDSGYERGYMEGHRHGMKKWIATMEQRRGPDGLDEVVRIIERNTPAR